MSLGSSMYIAWERLLGGRRWIDDAASDAAFTHCPGREKYMGMMMMLDYCRVTRIPMEQEQEQEKAKTQISTYARNNRRYLFIHNIDCASKI